MSNPVSLEHCGSIDLRISQKMLPVTPIRRSITEGDVEWLRSVVRRTMLNPTDPRDGLLLKSAWKALLRRDG